jgi:hypothetical protein
MNFNNTVKLFVITLISFVLIGCASAPPTTVLVPTVATRSQINSPDGLIVADGEATVVVRETATETSRTYQSAKSKTAAKLELELAKLQAGVEVARAKAHASAEKAKARAENPCSSWFLAPSYCYGYTPYSGRGDYGPIGSNGSFRTGSGRSNLQLPRGPSGGNSNFSGGNSGSTGGASGGNTGGTN